MTATMQDPVARLTTDVAALYRLNETLLNRQAQHEAHTELRLGRIEGEAANQRSRFEMRFDRVDADIAELKSDVSVLKADVSELKSDVSVLKADVSELKSDVSVLKGDVSRLKQGLAETRDQLNRFEHATERRFNRIDAQFERLFGLIKRSETTR